MVSRPARLLPFALAAVVAACSHVAHFGAGSPSSRYYKDDGPGDRVPANLDSIPDATPHREPLNRFANRPYTVLGRDYVPATDLKPYRERGVASWYGRKFHGQKTALGETYDMYAMTAAHPTLPLPSYARVTNVASGKSVVVRVNDRGPFLHDRIIDLSYAAAQRIGVAQQGSGEVIVEAVLPGDAIVAAPLPPVGDIPPQTMVKPAAPAIFVGDGTPPAQAGAGRFIVQLGAFRDNGNAQNFLARIREQVAGIAGDARVSQIDGLWRVYVGPYDNQTEARRISDRLYASLGIDNTVAQH